MFRFMKPRYLILHLATLIAAVSLSAQVSVPYASDFEDHQGFVDETPLAGDWAATNNSVVVTDDEAQSGTQSIRIPFAGPENFLSLSFDASGSAVLFADYYMQLTASVVPELPSLTRPETTALFAVQPVEPGLGEWLFLDGDGLGSGLWFTAGDLVPLDDSDRTDWHRITLRFDLASNVWDAYIDENLLAINLGFVEALTIGSEAINIYGSQEGVAYLDTFRLAAENPLCDDADLDGIEDAFDLDSTVDDRDLDPDKDGLTNIEEYAYGTNPEVFNEDEGIVSEVLYNRTSWYIDSINGDDVSGVGSAAAPFKSLSAALSLNSRNPGYLGDGDTLYLAAGEYVSTVTEIAIAGLTVEGTLDDEGIPLTKIGNLKVTAADVTLKNLDFHNTELTLQGASGALITNNTFSGSVNTSLSLIGASDNLIRNNHFASAIHQCVSIYWDSATGQASNDNRFLSNYFTHRPSAVTNQIIYCNWTIEDPASICARNRFVNCAFEETVSDQLNKVIYDGSTWWMVVDDEYSVRFEDCYFKRADRDEPFSEFKIVEGHPDFQWRWDELTNDAWVSLNYQYAITGDYNGWDHLPRVQFVDGDNNGSAIEKSHSAGLWVTDNADDDGNPADPDENNPTLTDRTDWHVDAINGDDATGIGSEAEPFKSLAVVLSLNVNHPSFVGVGDTIHLAEGQYDPASVEIAIAGLTLEGALDDEGIPLTKIGNLKVTAADVTLKNLDFHNTELTLQGASGALITNNIFSGSVNTGLSLIGASNNVISHNHFASAIHQCVSIYWDSATGEASNDNLFLSNHFTHRLSDLTNQIIYCDWTAANVASICARNRFVDCAFEETVSGQLNKVIYDGSTWWMVEEHEYSLRFEDCFFKKADRLTPFSRFTILELVEEPDSEWQWDELLNDEWVAPDYQHAITGDHNNWGHAPRIQFVDADENDSVVEQEHAAGLLAPEVDNYAPVVENRIASVTVGKDAEPSVIDLYNVFEDVETADANLTFSIVNTNPTFVTSEITDGTLTLEYSNTTSTATVTVTATDDNSENPLSANTTFSATIFIDADGDELNDEFEQAIIDSNPNDDINSLEDVLPKADFDGDGYSNYLESVNNTDPTDPTDNLNDFSVPNYSLIDLGEGYGIHGIGNKGHVLMESTYTINLPEHYRRWYWGEQVDFYARDHAQYGEPFKPFFRFHYDSMNNHGEIAGRFTAKGYDESVQTITCPSSPFGDTTNLYVKNFYRRPVIVQNDGTYSVKEPPPGMEGHSFDSSEYRVIRINDNGNYLIHSVPSVYLLNNFVFADYILGYFTHEYKDGAYINKNTSYSYKVTSFSGMCLWYLWAKDGVFTYPSFIKYNNNGFFAGVGYRQTKWVSLRSSHMHSIRFNFAGSLQNTVDYRTLDLNQNNLIIGKLENSLNPQLFNGNARYDIPNLVGRYKFCQLSSPEEDEALILLASHHLATQKHDPQTGDLVPISNGADAYTMTTAEQILHKPDAQGNPTQNAEWSSPTFSLISDNGNFIAGNAIKNGVSHAVLWVKMGIGSDPVTGPEEFRNKYINRFKPERDWDNEEERKDLPRGEPLYAGDGPGDQVCYKAYIPGVDASIITNYRWWAEGVDEYRYITQNIVGPEGADENEWLIEAGNLDWTPGKYKIKLEVTFNDSITATAEYEQEIGWRTPELVSIGQILPFDTHDIDVIDASAFRFNLLKGAISLSGDRVGLDLSDTLVADALAGLSSLAVGTTKKHLELYAGVAVGVNFDTIPAGPLDGTSENMYLWAIQTFLNDNSDEELVMPESFERSFLSDTVLDPRALFFRIFSVFQADLLVDENFKIVEANPTYSSEYPSKSLVENGPTKLNIGLTEGEFFEGGEYLGIELPPLPWADFTYSIKVESERSSETGLKQNESMYSLYGSARIAEDGQKLNWGLTGYDAPWIFIEPIFKADTQNHKITFELRTSVDMVIDDQASVVSGECPFNEIKLYKRSYDNSEGEDTFLFERIFTLPLENSLECFIKSSPHAIIPAPKTTSHVE